MKTTNKISRLFRQCRNKWSDHKAYELDGTPRPVTLRLVNQYGDRDSNHPVGVGVEMRIQNRKTLRLLLDTGASGILITQRAADKAGLDHLGATKGWGIGDKGTQNAFLSVSDTCSIGRAYL